MFSPHSFLALTSRVQVVPVLVLVGSSGKETQYISGMELWEPVQMVVRFPFLCDGGKVCLEGSVVKELFFFDL